MAWGKSGNIKGPAAGSSGYFYEEIALPAQSVASSAAYNPLVNLVAANGTVIGDYPSGFAAPGSYATGSWVCPVTGIYAVSLNVAFSAWVSGSRLLMAINRNNTTVATMLATYDAASNSGKVSLSTRKILQAGDVLRFQIGQVTGAAQVVTAGTEQSYLSIQREYPVAA